MVMFRNAYFLNSKNITTVRAATESDFPYTVIVAKCIHDIDIITIFIAFYNINKIMLPVTFLVNLFILSILFLANKYSDDQYNIMAVLDDLTRLRWYLFACLFAHFYVYFAPVVFLSIFYPSIYNSHCTNSYKIVTSQKSFPVKSGWDKSAFVKLCTTHQQHCMENHMPQCMYTNPPVPV